MKRSGRNNKVNEYIRERIRQARLEANETQNELSERLQKSRVAISDLERGRVSVSAADLLIIAMYYDKPISYFFPERVSVSKGELSSLEEELIKFFRHLPDTQKRIALEYVKQQSEIVDKAEGRRIAKKQAEIRSGLAEKDL